MVGIIHRDLKPENMLLDDHDRIKLTDFGCSLITDIHHNDINVTNTAGSALYFSPEVCTGSHYKGKKSDIWALGVTLYQMVFKQYPFAGRSQSELYPKIINSE